MSSSPQCKRCGDYVHSGEVVCYKHFELQDGEMPQYYIERRIHEIFNDLAEQIGKAEIEDPNYAAGIPFELFTKCEKLKAAWRSILEQVT